MAIPGYDPDDIAEFLLERETGAPGASAAVAAVTVPASFGLVESDRERPERALSDPVEVTGLEDVNGFDALRIAIEYDPGALPAAAGPTDVTIAVETGDGFEAIDSEVDADETVVEAILAERPPGGTMVAVYEHEM